MKKYIRIICPLSVSFLVACTASTKLPSRVEPVPVSIQQVPTSETDAAPNEFVFCTEEGAWKCKDIDSKTVLGHAEINRRKRDFALEKLGGTTETFLDDHYESKITPDFKVFFDFDKSVLLEPAKVILDNSISKMNQGGAVVVLQGYTDSIGEKSYNDSLAHQRAASVKAYIEGNGVTTEVVFNGEGDCCYIDTNDTEDGRAKNRRVEIYIKAN